ncbi:MAG: hypothetical protein O7C75_17125 [Verrucomicrobia bacterium]|nr:hypothetical protein [Verrucomicrobiota bacterium]
MDEVKDIRDKSEAMRHYARQANNKELEIDCAEIRYRAERRVGELLVEQKETVGLAKGGGDTSTGSRVVPVQEPLTLAEAGIDKKLSMRSQKLAAISDEDFEEQIEDWRTRVEVGTERVITSFVIKGIRPTRHVVQELPSGFFDLIYADPPWRYQVTDRG